MLKIPANDHGALYVLACTGPVAAGLGAQDVPGLLGLADARPEFIDVIQPGTLSGMALPDLIRQGYDLPITTADAATLAALTDTVILMMSRAFGEQAQDITLPAGTRVVMVLRGTAPLPPPGDLHATSAAGAMNGAQIKAPKSDARIGGMVATVALLVMFALVGLMVWVGG